MTTTAAVLVLGSVLLLPSALGKGAGGEERLTIDSETTVKMTPISDQTATYSGRVSSTADPRGNGKKDRRRRQNIADRCDDNRIVEVWHGNKDTGFLIGEVPTDDDGRWRLVGNLAPEGSVITVVLAYETRRDAACVELRERKLVSEL